MNLLALDTATEACSVAARINGRWAQRFVDLGRGHTDALMPMIHEVMEELGAGFGDLERLAVGRGPGAFTGVRIGVACAQGLAQGLGVPVAPVSNLAAMAWVAAAERGDGLVAVAIDARAGGVYFGGFDTAAGRLPEPVIAERVCPPEQVPLIDRPRILTAGTGWTRHPEVLAEAVGCPTVDSGVRLPSARAIAELALLGAPTVAAADVEPVYLRDQVVHAPKAKA
ncbi:tRNA (adenosine(37)-N6)-threonylcarbamoyltransferase complex dimerization subunit type 1 TsaB [uncultured Abyssibacter sp.]|uniref:tRNA (adenosine(37)-N6)-threonylcarbamoyltransferase complex dimerization subunit type 1 TsaB n=1 Tax=uncultured Abyssibacter sp. TaxID=2320202 RepID=UPI0032B24EB6